MNTTNSAKSKRHKCNITYEITFDITHCNDYVHFSKLKGRNLKPDLNTELTN